MAKYEVEIASEIAEWASRTAAQHSMSLDAYIEMLIALESGLKSTVRDGRTLRSRAFLYRDADAYFASGEAMVREEA